MVIALAVRDKIADPPTKLYDQDRCKELIDLLHSGDQSVADELMLELGAVADMTLRMYFHNRIGDSYFDYRQEALLALWKLVNVGPEWFDTSNSSFTNFMITTARRTIWTACQPYHNDPLRDEDFTTRYEEARPKKRTDQTEVIIYRDMLRSFRKTLMSRTKSFRFHEYAGVYQELVRIFMATRKVPEIWDLETCQGDHDKYYLIYAAAKVLLQRTLMEMGNEWLSNE